MIQPRFNQCYTGETTASEKRKVQIPEVGDGERGRQPEQQHRTHSDLDINVADILLSFKKG